VAVEEHDQVVGLAVLVPDRLQEVLFDRDVAVGVTVWSSSASTASAMFWARCSSNCGVPLRITRSTEAVIAP
jgi:hypothetical protein